MSDDRAEIQRRLQQQSERRVQGGRQALAAELAHRANRRAEIKAEHDEVPGFTPDLRKREPEQTPPEPPPTDAAEEPTALRERVAATAGLSPGWAPRLRGETEDELTEDAERLAKFAKPPTPKPSGDIDAGRDGVVRAESFSELIRRNAWR